MKKELNPLEEEFNGNNSPINEVLSLHLYRSRTDKHVNVKYLSFL